MQESAKGASEEISRQINSAGGQSSPGMEPARAPTANDYASAALQGIAEDEDRLPSRPLQWLVLMVVAIAVGAGTGVVGGLFRITLGAADHGRTALISWAHGIGGPWVGWVIPTGACAAAAGIASYLTQRLAPHTSGSGIPRVEAVLRHHLRPAEIWILPVKFIGGALSIGSGLALGREGPTVQMGGTVGRIVGDGLKKFVPEPWTMIAAGAGAGLAVAFNAPLAATLFVMEELLHRFSARVFSATLMSCISGTVVLRFILGNSQELGGPHISELPADVLPGYLVLGVLAGFTGVAFNVSLVRALELFDRARHWPRGAKGVVVGAAVGVAAWFAPGFVGGGESLAQFAVQQRLVWTVVVTLLLGRFVLTMFSYGCGAPGGIFAPLLAVGALLGNAFASGQSALLHLHADPAPYAIVAMAACFTAIVRSPLTGVVLLLEMTGGWTLILPMMAASVTAYAVPELLGNPPIYDSLREREEAMERARVPQAAHVRPEPAVDKARLSGVRSMG
jgi:CIC family chloride channel protein